jgi:hypothetical protein
VFIVKLLFCLPDRFHSRAYDPVSEGAGKVRQRILQLMASVTFNKKEGTAQESDNLPEWVAF